MTAAVGPVKLSVGADTTSSQKMVEAESFEALVERVGPLPTTALASASTPPAAAPKCAACGGSGEHAQGVSR